MFIRKFLKPNQVDEVNAKGRFIKVMNCEGVFRIRVLSQGRALVDTDAAAGFDIQTSETFDFIEITSDIEQKLQIWVSEHKLSYDALSTKASRSSSFVVGHSGESQQILPYDPEQSAALIGSDDAPLWIGGEGVTKETGFIVDAGKTYRHESAAPLYAFIDAVRGKMINPKSKEVKVLGDGGTNPSFYSVGGGYLVSLKGVSGRNVDIYDDAGDLVLSGIYPQTYKNFFYADGAVWMVAKYKDEQMVARALVVENEKHEGAAFDLGYSEYYPHSSVSIGSVVYMVISGSSGSKFVSFVLGGGINELEKPNESIQGGVISYDQYTGKIDYVVWAEGGRYSYDRQSKQYEQKAKGKTGSQQTIFFEDYIAVGQELYSRDGNLIFDNYDMYFASRGGITAFKNNEVFHSYDGVGFSKIDDLPVKAKAFYTSADHGVLYMQDETIAGTPRALAYYPLIDDGSIKAKIKVFKELF